MNKFDLIFDELRNETDKLYKKFLQPHLPANPEEGPENFEHDVKAFSILVHAAIEEFVENISSDALGKIETDFLKGSYSLSTVCLVISYGIKADISTEDNSTQVTCFNHVKNAIEAAKQKHSSVLKENHGVSPRYLRQILTPIGINIPTGTEIDSLIKIADARGSFAHSLSKQARYGEYKKATRIFTPEEAKNAAEDCTALCDEIRKRATKRFFETSITPNTSMLIPS